MTPDMQTALAALRANCECSQENLANGESWSEVYLDNAKPRAWSGNKGAGVLSALEKVGVYKPIDGACFGDVLLSKDVA